MRKFKDGDRVRLLSKSCGDVTGLESMLERHYIGKVPLPSHGTVVSFDAYHDRHGPFYSVEIDDYDARIHVFRIYCFKEFDLAREFDWDIEELFDL